MAMPLYIGQGIVYNWGCHTKEIIKEVDMSNEEDIELELGNGDKAVFYSAEAACQYLGVSYQTLNRYRSTWWVLPAGKVGISYLYTKARLDECRVHKNFDRKDEHVEVTRV